MNIELKKTRKGGNGHNDMAKNFVAILLIRRILGTSIRKLHTFIINPNDNCKLMIEIRIGFNNLL